MTGGPDERFTDDEPTEPGGGSILANAIRNLRLALHEIDRDLEEASRNFDGLEESERVHALHGIAAKMGELGDIGHDTRRALNALADDGYSSLTKF